MLKKLYNKIYKKFRPKKYQKKIFDHVERRIKETHGLYLCKWLTHGSRCPYYQSNGESVIERTERKCYLRCEALSKLKFPLKQILRFKPSNDELTRHLIKTFCRKTKVI